MIAAGCGEKTLVLRDCFPDFPEGDALRASSGQTARDDSMNQ